MQNLFKGKEVILLGSVYGLLFSFSPELSLLVSIDRQFLSLIQAQDHKAQGKKNKANKAASVLAQVKPSTFDFKYYHKDTLRLEAAHLNFVFSGKAQILNSALLSADWKTLFKLL